MSAPRWTLDTYGYGVLRDGKRAFAFELSPYFAHDSAKLSSSEMDALARRIVALLNATELAPTAVATLQSACMFEAGRERELAEEIAPLSDPEGRQRLATLDALTDTLNHAARVYVELDEEASIALDGGGSDAR